MGQVLSTDKVLAGAAQIINVWKANPEFSLGNLKLEDFQAKETGLRTTDATLEAKRTEITALMNQRDALAAELNALTSRARSGFRAAYGPDSTQYEQAGGTRTSERKRPTRKPKDVK